MTDPLRSEAAAGLAQAVERDREARVEELLLSGLDHYFAAQYDLAINVWTRVLFLDRGHARARAYIERARGAIAERQREGEELVHTGAAAFQRGESDTARRLLTSAVEHGAATEEALALLDRLDRLEAAGVQRESRTEPRALARRGHDTADEGRRDRAWLAWIAAGVVLGVAAVAVALTMLGTRGEEWLPIGGPAPRASVRAPDERLTVPSASDVWLARARVHYGKGRLREALTVLDAIGPDDALSIQADELRAAIQRQLLAAARAGEPATAVRQPPGDTPRQ
jgi:tetratricopeptide (TPR) repeat protein